MLSAFLSAEITINIQPCGQHTGEGLTSKSNWWVYEDWWPQGRESYPPIGIPVFTERKLTSKGFVTIKKTTIVGWVGLVNV